MKRIIVLVFIAFVFFGAKPIQGKSIAHALVGYTDGTFQVVPITSDFDYVSVIQKYAQRPNVAYVEKESFFKSALAPNDPLYQNQSTLQQINAETAWNVTTGASNVVVAVIDNGVDIYHPDLIGNIWKNSKEISGNGVDDDQNGFIDDVNGWNFVDGNADVTPQFNGSSSIVSNHGTVVAGVIGATGNNAIGVAGVAWNVSIMPLRALNANGIGSSVAIASAITYAVNNGATIINLSLEGQTSSNAILQAIQAARNRGVIVIAAAGNDNVNLATSPVYPACNPGVIGVASVDGNNRKSSFSNFGSVCVAVSAPGESIVSTVSSSPNSGMSSLYTILPGSQSGWAGTSFAAPYVAGVAALVKSTSKNLDREQLEELLSSTAATSLDSQNPSYIGMLGGGIIDSSLAVTASAPTTTKDNILTLPIGGGGPHLKGFTSAGALNLSKFVESTSYRGGGDIATGDVNTDGSQEILYAAGSNIQSTVKIFSTKGNLLKTFTAFSSPRNGLRIASGDINGDGADEIIVTRASKATPEIRIFNSQGTLLSRFNPYPNSFTGGLSLATADVNGDGKAEIIVGTGKGGLPRVLVFDRKGKKLFEFLAYGKGFRGGVNVAAGDVTGDGVPEIITSPMTSGGPEIRIFSNKGNLQKKFFAFDQSKQKTGVSVSVADITGTGVESIFVSPHQTGFSEGRIFSYSGSLIKSIQPYGAKFKGGFSMIGLTP